MTCAERAAWRIEDVVAWARACPASHSPHSFRLAFILVSDAPAPAARAVAGVSRIQLAEGRFRATGSRGAWIHHARAWSPLPPSGHGHVARICARNQ